MFKINLSEKFGHSQFSLSRAISYFLLSLLLAFITVLYPAVVASQSLENLAPLISKKTVLIFTLFYFVCMILIKKTHITLYIHKYRYLIGFCVLVFLVLFEISGSSIGSWINYVNDGSMINDGTILGVSRPIRTDEWDVFTPFAFSQSYSSYQYFSDIVRGSATDMFMIYGQPIFDISMIFRPFQVGYLLLGNSFGLSFYWCSRLICLFLVTYDFFYRIISKKNKLLSFTSSILVTFSPMIQWWFSINGYVEMIIAIELSVVLLDIYIKKNNLPIRIACSIGIMICAGMYVLTLYPAVMIPLTYVLVGLIVYVIANNVSNKQYTINITKLDVIVTITIVLIFLGLLARIFLLSFDTILSVINTSYPGKREYSGGDVPLAWLFDSFYNIPFPVTGSLTSENCCEAARFIDLCPLGYILSIILFIHGRKNGYKLNLLCKILIPINIFLTIVVIFPMPRFLMLATLLSKASSRIVFVIGYCNILIFISSANQYIKQYKSNKSIPLLLVVVSIALFVGILVFNHVNSTNRSEDYVRYIIFILTGVFMVIFCLLILSYKSKACLSFFVLILSVSVIFGGFLVNPFRIGTAVVEDQAFSRFIQQTSLNNNGKWATIDCRIRGNFLVANGAPTLNSTNVYPDIEKWSLIDNGDNFDIYNRYAHINFIYRDQKDQENQKFVLNGPDIFTVYLNSEDIDKLDIKYIVTDADSKFAKDTKLRNIYNDEQYTVYECD